jgi:hypothetical protein
MQLNKVNSRINLVKSLVRRLNDDLLNVSSVLDDEDDRCTVATASSSGVPGDCIASRLSLSSVKETPNVVLTLNACGERERG